MKYGICNIVGHKWVYSFTTNFSEKMELRACKRCGTIEEYRTNIPVFNAGWFQLVQRTKKGALKLLARLS